MTKLIYSVSAWCFGWVKQELFTNMTRPNKKLLQEFVLVHSVVVYFYFAYEMSYCMYDRNSQLSANYLTFVQVLNLLSLRWQDVIMVVHLRPLSFVHNT